MTDEPISSANLGRLLLFALLLLPPAVLLVGIVPIVIVVFGLVMAHRNRDFSHIAVAQKNYSRYFNLLSISVVALAAYDIFHHRVLYGASWAAIFSDIDVSWKYFLALAILAGIAVYQFAGRAFFLAPLLEHEHWVENHGLVLRVRPPELPDQRAVNIIKGEKLRTFSVADELLKWAKLKENGHITEAEFIAARKALLKR